MRTVAGLLVGVVLITGFGGGTGCSGCNALTLDLQCVEDPYYRNLSGEDLSGKDLSGQYFVYANLTGANLTGANLTGANLTGAYISGANLSGANLAGADLGGADLSGAVANVGTVWPNGFDPVAAGVIIE